MTDELDRFRTAWGHRPVDAPFEPAKEEPMEAIVQNVTLLDRRQLRRDVREIAIAAGATGVLASTLMWATEPWFRAWILILSASAALIAVWRYIALFRRRNRPTADSLSTFCRSELSRLDTEIRLQRTLAWWYLAPILIGTNLYVFLSSEGSATAMMVVFPITAAVVVGIALATRRSLRRELLSLREELTHCLDELEADGGA
jgi:hypothetical protein